ncbi:hypothetical protein LY76DRAFT_604540 [Colletotrichum caudatum]|nr:hypothetical protein LY76DRAFT_604540 [Colletotrichum caudatum]
MRFTLALTTLVAVAMAAPLNNIVARKDELTAAIAALAEENPADADAAKSVLDRDLQLDQDEEVSKRETTTAQAADEDEEEEEEDVAKPFGGVPIADVVRKVVTSYSVVPVSRMPLGAILLAKGLQSNIAGPKGGSTFDNYVMSVRVAQESGG